MSAKEDQDFEMFQGDEVTLSFALDATNLTNPVGQWGFMTSPNAKNFVFQTDSNSGRISFQNNGGAWTMQVSIIASNTQGVRPGVYYHMARVSDNSGVVPDVVATGQMTLKNCPFP